MRNILMICLIVICLPLVAMAQDPPKAEVFGGFSILSADLGDREKFYGFQTSVAGNFHKNFGIAADVGGQYKDLNGNSVYIYEFLFGPRFSIRNDAATVFAHALFGGVHAGGAGDSQNGFAMGFGGGIDVNVNNRFAVRVVQFDWTPNRINDIWSKSEVRFGFGIVIKAGN